MEQTETVLKDTRPIRVRRAMNVGPAETTQETRMATPTSDTKEALEPTAGHGMSGSLTATKSEPLTWRDYSDWRRTKCQPPELRAPIWLDELDQAIHEFVGECAELAALLLEAGPWILIPDHPSRAKALDEIGDVVFTGCWAMDCLNESFFGSRGPIDNHFISKEHADGIERTHNAVLSGMKPEHITGFEKLHDNTKAVVLEWYNDARFALLNLQTHAGMLANRFKKLRWQRRMIEGQTEEQVQSAFYAFTALDEFCVLAGLSLEEAARQNMEKLDKRYPQGWTPGGGER